MVGKFDNTKFTKCIIGLISLVMLTSCSLKKINDQTKFIDQVVEITGQVKIESDRKGPVSVFLFRDDKGPITLINRYELTGDGRFIFHVPPDNYLVAAFIDSNGDGKYEQGEHATYHGLQTGYPKIIEAKELKKIKLKTFVIKGPLEDKKRYEVKEELAIITRNIGKVIAYNDPMFSEQNASLGMWRPLDFINEVGGGLYLLQTYDPKKIPVVFVHGIGGHAGNFSEMLKNLDTSKFQAFVLYYPSGVRLDMVSDYLVKAMNTLEVRYRFKDFYVVAHSMGGVVARSFIKKYYSQNHSANIKFFMTINSPLMGMDSAISGVNWSPIVMPVWRDIASNSIFIKDLHEWTMPKEIPYHLVYSQIPGKEGDGVVPMKSQLTPKLKKEAVEIHGFNSTHAGLLKEEQFVTFFNQILVQYR